MFLEMIRYFRGIAVGCGNADRRCTIRRESRSDELFIQRDKAAPRASFKDVDLDAPRIEAGLTLAAQGRESTEARAPREGSTVHSVAAAR